ncbi:MAG: peptide-methionine (S)-S-oxide reductase MsrA [Prevotellaceae bacterium]|jgi:peptide methionine sulfoxide reductase msrA/msrB|nr:peptide-methionine (S)-S-oxide reductase MsrA [Prevotellaceae bacterium]
MTKDNHTTFIFETAIFAGGCFWGVEYYMQKAKGVTVTTAGFIGGSKCQPTYEEVCKKDTGHAEAVRVIFDTTQTNFETLARLFFEIHDPTQTDRQGTDIGTQYRSEIFYTTLEQKKIAEQLIDELVHNGYKVVTHITPAPTFWPADGYHQDYYNKKGLQPHCHVRVKRFKDKEGIKEHR